MDIFLAIALFVLAVGYAAVGLGGGSGYIAVLTFWSHDPNIIRPISWGLNVIAAGVGFANFYRAGYFRLGFAAPLVVGGIVGAAVGARLPISAATFGKLLAVTLILVALQMIPGKRKRNVPEHHRRLSWAVLLAIGLAIGVLSGLLGMGGGVVLGPVILLVRLADIKTSAATTSLYVALSSAGALGAHVAGGGDVEWLRLLGFGCLCLIGGYLGSAYGARKASPRALELTFGAIVLIAGVQLALAAF
jgi:uncharacterized membrane protein YfcA